MNKKYEDFFEPIVFHSGVELSSRFVMSPMVVEGSSEDGHVGEEDINYFARRSKSASMLITGATSVTKDTNAFGYGLANYSDSHIEGMKKLAQTMKKDGAKAVMQIFHPGREARFSFEEGKSTYGPSSMKFSFLNYPTIGLTEKQIEGIIKDFGKATLRAIEAGFDGIEIHGANHYLIQQFFSKMSNKREDQWGGTLKKRAAFPLAVVDEVKRVIEENANSSFILGYRISPEELNEGSLGYSLDDALYLIQEIEKKELDYLHISQTGPNGFKNTAQLGKFKGKVIAKVIKRVISEETKMIIAGDITSPNKALEASKLSDLVALASVVIVEPDFVEKIFCGKENAISLDITGRKKDLRLPRNLYLLKGALKGNQSIPEKTISLLNSGS